ncbi:hypothetical protein [Nocardioides yefusunii]|uniref:Uncharacterized protein n=1 Tax=Nocardioides yefusunii TaxID=2500546 RepID=A0ABW1QTY2_9ACTN|nr:hypothetical protein [Nocardioides yefusunii]
MKTLPTSALLWGAWAVTAVLTVLVSTGWTIPAVVILAGALTWPCLGRARRGIGAWLISACVALTAVWTLLGVVQHREGTGGDVLWILPAWQPTSGGSFGGAVTTGQLELALLQGVRGVAVLTVLGLLHRAVDGTGWVRATALVAGPAVGVLAPLACLGDARCAQELDRTAVRHHGLAPHWRLGTSVLGDLWDRAVHRSRDLVGVVGTTPGLIAPVFSLTAASAALLLAMRRSLASGPELGAIALGSAVLVAAVVAHLRGSRFETPAGDAVAAGSGAVALLGAHVLSAHMLGTHVLSAHMLGAQGVAGDVVVTATALLVLPAVALVARPATQKGDAR